MTFLNLILLAGMTGAAVPIVIHVFHRQRVQRVRWGAMHLLDRTLGQNRRRMKFDQFLLLFARCLIPFVLAFAMARPVLTGGRALLGRAKTSTVIVLDNSYSMESGGGDNSSFVEAKNAAIHILEGLERGSDAAIILMSGGESISGPDGSENLGGLAQEIRNIQPGGGRANVPGSLLKAADVLSRMQNHSPQIIVLSDFQRVSWSGDESIARMSVSKSLFNNGVPTELILWHAGNPVRENISMESLEFAQTILGADQPIQVRANLRNYGQKAWPDLRVFFRVDGKERAVSQISVAARQEAHVLFSHTFNAPGSHWLEVYAEADSLRADNAALASIPVWGKIPVLLVTGNQASEPLEGETAFLEIALQPFANAKSSVADLIESKVISPEQLTTELLSQARALVLANVRQLSDPQVQSIKTFIREGGGCIVFPGDRINTEWYNRVLADPSDPLLPGTFHSIRGGREIAATHIASQNRAHPALDFLNDPRNGSLSDAMIKFWYEVRQRQDSNVSMLARLENGDPFLLEQKYGEGRLIEAVVPCDSDWSNLPTRPFYLPLMQRLMIYLASRVYPPRNVDVGDSLFAFLPPSEAGKKASLLDPGGRRHELGIQAGGAHAVVRYDNTACPGLYVLSIPNGQTIHFVVNASRAESDLDELSGPEQKKVAREMDAHLVSSVTEYQRLDNANRFGFELWQGAVWLVLFISFSEFVMQQRFARRKT